MKLNVKNNRVNPKNLLVRMRMLSRTSAEKFSPPVRLGLNTVLLGLWLWLYRPVLAYLGEIFSGEQFRTNQILLVMVLALLFTRLRREGVRLWVDAPPRLYLPAVLLVFGGSGAFLIVERYLDVNTLSATLFGLASYGLLGLWMRPQSWRAGLPAALLLVGVLPFGEHLQTFVGYPMRILTAEIVREGFAAAGVNSLGVDTILVFENGVSQVDIPCSGIKSLWTGALFLLAATWIERRALNRRWFLIAAVFATLLFAANLSRVGILVLVGQVMGWRLAAEMLHVPLGVLGFTAACAGAMLMLRIWVRAKDNTQPISPHASAQPVWLAPFLALSVLVMVWAYTPRPVRGAAQPDLDWQFPKDIEIQALPLSPQEIEWITQGGADSATRVRFVHQDLSGSMIFITSRSWRGQHRPERCFEVYGLTVEETRTTLVDADFPVRLVSLGHGNQKSVLSAVYWFQSTNRTTDDYGTRIWADLAPERQKWVLVTILFDDVLDPQSGAVQSLFTSLHEVVERNLKGELSHE